MIHFKSSNLSENQARQCFSNEIRTINGKSFISFPRYSNNDYPDIVFQEINQERVNEIKKLYQHIDPKDEENFRLVVGCESDYSLYLIKIPIKKIEQSIELEKLDDHREFLRKITTYLTINHQENLPNVSPPTEPIQPNFLQGKPESLCSSTALRNSDINSHKTFCDFAGSLIPRPDPENCAIVYKNKSSNSELGIIIC